MSYISSSAQTSQGTILQVDNNPVGGGSGSPPTWVTVSEFTDMAFSNKNMFADVTNTQSAAKEFLATLQDPGKCSGTMNRVSNDPGQVILQTIFANQPPLRALFQVIFPINLAAGQTTRGDVWQFLGYVESISPDVKVDKQITNKTSIQITGGITVIEGA